MVCGVKWGGSGARLWGGLVAQSKIRKENDGLYLNSGPSGKRTTTCLFARVCRTAEIGCWEDSEATI